jgi:hypothetical protein
MPVKSYVSRDSQGRPWPPDHKHEAQPLIEIVKKLWLAFDNQQELYALVVNLHRPSADLVLLSQRGIGVVELKHYYGDIHRKGSTWYAGKALIKAGSENRPYRNPHEQVQAYATKIRNELIGVGSKPCLPGRLYEQKEFKFNTAVCFTHPDAQIERFKEGLRRSPLDTRQWERFDVLEPNEVTDWAASLRFEVDKGPAENYEPYQLSTGQITRIAERYLDGTEWTEISGLMPTGEPYAYLTLIEGEQRLQIFSLDREELSLGRDADILIPEQFKRVSREHALIKRRLGKVMIEDQDSRNGTYVNQVRVRRSRPLKRRDQITLGGPRPSSKVCLLVFTESAPIEPAVTEAAAGDF